MFKKHYDRMRPGATPERVLAIARMIRQKPMGQMEVAKLCELRDDVSALSEGIRYTLAAAEELGLIENREGKYHFVAEDQAVASPGMYPPECSPKGTPPFSKQRSGLCPPTRRFCR